MSRQIKLFSVRPEILVLHSATHFTDWTPKQIARFAGTNPVGHPSGMEFGHLGILSMRQQRTGTPSANDVVRPTSQFVTSTSKFIIIGTSEILLRDRPLCQDPHRP